MTAGSRPVTSRAVLIAVALLATAAGLLLGQVNDEAAAAPPQEESVDVGFSRDMREHHARAVQMSLLVREATTDREVRTLALDILLTQQQQAGQLYGWLAAWGVPRTSVSSPLQWMGGAAVGGATDSTAMGSSGDPGTDPSAAPGMQMAPSMAIDEALQRLARLEGLAAERLYLQLMIPHHQGGVAMAKVAAAQAQEPQVRRLAQSIVESQTAEIAVLRQMLAARGGAPPPA